MNADRIRATTDRLPADRDSRGAAARPTLYDLQRPSHDLPALVAGTLSDVHRTVLDLGCGDGTHLARLRSERPAATVVGVDAEPGRLEDLPPPVLCAAAAQLPVTTESVDAVLALHALYHLPDIDAALAEAARVLKPGGVLVASTNAADDKRELDDLFQAAAADVLGTAEGPRPVHLSDRFPLETAAAQIEEHFADVSVRELTGTITAGDPAPVLEHLGSYRVWAARPGCRSTRP